MIRRSRGIRRYGGSGGITVPAPAAAAGFNTLVFNDDFTTDSVATSNAQNFATGINWFIGQRNENPATTWSVQKTIHASDVSNGNTGGGPFPSSSGGILTFTTGNTSGCSICTAPGHVLTTVPALGQGNWRHFYVEFYMQTKPNGNTLVTQTQGNSWPSLWAWDVQDLSTMGFGGPVTGTAGTATEMDFIETYGTIFGNTPGWWGSAIHYPAGTTTTASFPPSGNGGALSSSDYVTSEWALYGFLWTAGAFASYRNNTFIGNMTPNITTSCPDLEGRSQSLIVIMGAGELWPMSIDYVRIWQAP